MPIRMWRGGVCQRPEQNRTLAILLLTSLVFFCKLGREKANEENKDVTSAQNPSNTRAIPGT